VAADVSFSRVSDDGVLIAVENGGVERNDVDNQPAAGYEIGVSDRLSQPHRFVVGTRDTEAGVKRGAMVTLTSGVDGEFCAHRRFDGKPLRRSFCFSRRSSTAERRPGSRLGDGVLTSSADRLRLIFSRSQKLSDVRGELVYQPTIGINFITWSYAE
jgi:hypothetical protein